HRTLVIPSGASAAEARAAAPPIRPGDRPESASQLERVLAVGPSAPHAPAVTPVDPATAASAQAIAPIGPQHPIPIGHAAASAISVATAQTAGGVITASPVSRDPSAPQRLEARRTPRAVALAATAMAAVLLVGGALTMLVLRNTRAGTVSLSDTSGSRA